MALVAFSASSASAAPVNLVQDPGFENGETHTVYVPAPNYFADGVWQQTLGEGEFVDFDINAHSGNASYAPAQFDFPDGNVEQSLNTLTGQHYDLTFYYSFFASGNLQVSFGGVAVAFTSTKADGFYNMGTAIGLVATGPQTKLDFHSFDGTLLLDDVSVTASAPTTVPEPPGALVAGIGWLGMLAFRRRRALQGFASASI